MASEYGRIQDTVYAIIASPTFGRDGICFAAHRSGLSRSEDGGRTWHSSYNSLDVGTLPMSTLVIALSSSVTDLPDGSIMTPLTTTAVVVSPDFESDHTVFAAVEGGILRSVDTGKSWYLTTLPFPSTLVSTLNISPNFTHDGLLFAGTMESGVLCSSNRGNQWSQWDRGLLDRNILCAAIAPEFATDEALFVGTEKGLFYSAGSNADHFWQKTSFPSEYAPVLSIALSPKYAHDNVIFVGTETQGLFRSDDKGCTWQKLAGKDVGSEPVNNIVLSPEYPAKPHILVSLSSRLLVSRNGGQIWSNWEVELPIEQGVTSVAAPEGLHPGALLLVGLLDCGVLRVPSEKGL